MNAAVDRLAPSITRMIRMDHSHVLAIFHRYKADTSEERKRALVRNACLALEVHAQLEEEIFYPALRAVLVGDSVLEKSESEHNEMRGQIASLRAGVDANRLDADFDDKFMKLMQVVLHHVADEETQLLPAAERLLSDRLGQLGIEMTKRRVQLLKPHAGELATSTMRSFPAGAAAGAALLTAGALAIGAMLLSKGKNAEQRTRRWH